jgi:hypothetical protein
VGISMVRLYMLRSNSPCTIVSRKATSMYGVAWPISTLVQRYHLGLS